jgi:flagellar biosynthesis chaperone FliJ
MSSLSELYSKSKVRKQPEQVIQPQPQVDLSKTQNQISTLQEQLSNMSNSVSEHSQKLVELSLASEKCQKSRITDEYNNFVQAYNATIGEIQSCIVDISTRLTNVGY